MHGNGLAPARLQPEQRLGHRHLIHNELRFCQGALRDAVARLDDGGIGRFFSRLHARCACEEPADVDGVGGVVCALVNHFQDVGAAHNAGRDLHAAGSPTIGKRHFTRTKRYLVAWNRNGFQNSPTDGFFGALVQKTKVVVVIHGQAAFLLVGSAAWSPTLLLFSVFGLSRCCAWLARSLRTSSSSD